MRTVFILFDSLVKSALGCYGGQLKTPNFDRLASRSVVFDQHFMGSMPCMPARRDLQTGRLNFMHRSWGPLEPFDESFPVALRDNGIYSRLVTDHTHYVEDGGATYHNRYSSYDIIRGQESDIWGALVEPPVEQFRRQYHPTQFGGERSSHRIQGMVNEMLIKTENDYSTAKCFDSAISFLDANHHSDNWMLHLECFDPHEPFNAPEKYRQAIEETGYLGSTLTWPMYKKLEDETPEEIEELRANYAALVLMCDAHLGRLLEYFDDKNMWDDTAIVLTTDHGFMLSEHGWWGKLRMPCYNEIANIPLFVYHPSYSDRQGQRCGALTQAIDLMPTFLDFFGIEPSKHVLGSSLLPLVNDETDAIRDVALFGVFGGALNAADGRYTYFRYPENMDSALFEYTLMPMHSTSMFEVREFQHTTLHGGFNFTKGAPVLKIPALPDAKRPPMQGGGFEDTHTVLYDLTKDPQQEMPFRDPDIEARLNKKIVQEMKRHDAPQEIYARFGLSVR